MNAYRLSGGSALAAFEAALDEPEMRLLLTCCRAAAGTAEAGEVEAALATPWDPARFIGLTRVHRLDLLAYRHLVRPFGPRLTPDFRAFFEREFLLQMRLQARMAAAIVALHDGLREAGLRHAFLKGPVLSRQLFGEALLRQSNDLDVIVRRSDFPAAEKRIIALGFRPQVSRFRAWLHLPRTWSYRKDVTYIGPQGVRLELHWRTDLVETLWEDFKEAPLGETEFHQRRIPVLKDSLAAVYLCMHAAKHHWVRFRWVLDLPVFLRSRGVSPEELIAAADARGLGLAAREGLWIASRLLGTPQAGSRLPPARKERLARRFWLSQPGARKVETLALVLELAAIYPRPAMRLKYLASLLMDQILLKLGSKPLAKTLGAAP